MSEISKIFTKRYLKSELPLNAKIRASTLYQSLGGISIKTSLAIQQAQAQLGIAALRKHQIKPIQSILGHYDTLVIALTSSGKSAIYQIAALTMAEKKGQWTLVVEPTLSLISDQVQKLQRRDIPAAYITGLNHAEHRQIYRDLNRGRISILYMTPEKVATIAFQLAIQDTPPWLVMIDEVHCRKAAPQLHRSFSVQTDWGSFLINFRGLPSGPVRLVLFSGGVPGSA